LSRRIKKTVSVWYVEHHWLVWHHIGTLGSLRYASIWLLWLVDGSSVAHLMNSVIVVKITVNTKKTKQVHVF